MRKPQQQQQQQQRQRQRQRENENENENDDNDNDNDNDNENDYDKKFACLSAEAAATTATITTTMAKTTPPLMRPTSLVTRYKGDQFDVNCYAFCTELINASLPRCLPCYSPYLRSFQTKQNSNKQPANVR
eukprot:3679926-Amphidinium_carterae.1